MSNEHTPHEHTPTPGKKKLALVGLVVVGAAVVAVVTGIRSRAETDRKLEVWANSQAVPTVAVTAPAANKGERDLILPGTIQALSAAPLYGRVAGYLKTWKYDIGAKVKKGDELAEIDAPDVDQQLAHAKAQLASAGAAQKLSATTAVRWHALLGYQTVSQQSADEKVTDAQSKSAALDAAQASVGQLEAQEGFKHIIAPFDGVVTARNTDMGALINVGSSGKALFEVSDIHKVRIYVQVPQAFAGDLTPGLRATLTVPQYPDHPFEASLVSTANAFNETTRTVQVQLQADNADGKLWPGTYTEVMFHIPANPKVLRVPSTALVFGPHGMQVAVVGAEDKAQFKPVKIGRDLGNDAEIVTGLTSDDRVILSPPEWLSSGDVVKVAETPAPSVKVAEQGAK
jgi:RND family efflux transporter MFP subunit